MKNNKGFTLVELLVTVAILGIVTMMSFPLIRNISNSNNNSKYKAYLDSVVNGAKLYVDSYSIDMFGNQDTGCDFVTFDDLLSHNLVKDFDMNDITCNTSSTFVEVSKNGDKYTYKGYLGCTNKNSPGTLVYSLPNNGEENNPSSTCVNVTSTGTINFSLDNTPSSASLSSHALKKRTLKVVLSGTAGINAGFNVYYGWSEDRTGSDIPNADWKPLLFGHVPTIEQQKAKLKANQGPITTKSNFVDTPDGLTGSYYLVVRTNDLMDVYGSKWTNEYGSDTYGLGPFILDNTPPVFDSSSSILSTASGYNNKTPKLALNVTDNYSSDREMKMCVSYSSYCNDFVNYDAKKQLGQINKLDYNGTTHTVYVTVKDLAGNIAQRTFNYKEYKYCDHTKENSAVITCENVGGACTQFCGSEGVQYGEEYIGLLDSHFNNVSCGKKYRSTCTKPCNRNVSCNQSLILYFWGDVISDQTDCTGSSPHKQYKFGGYTCDCSYNGDGSLSNYVVEDGIKNDFLTHNYHEYSTIYYVDSDNGRSACKGDLPNNSYVKQICTTGHLNSSEDTIIFHGLRFYYGAKPADVQAFDRSYWFQFVYENGGRNAPDTHKNYLFIPNKVSEHPNEYSACEYACNHSDNKAFFFK